MNPFNRITVWSLFTGGIVIAVFLLGVWSCDAPDPTGPAATARIKLTTTDDTLPADGTSTALITAYIKDPRGNPAEGPIYWSTSCGRLDKSGETMSGGVSSVTLTAPNFPCTAVITADAVHAKTSIEIVCYSVEAQSITLSANPDDIPSDGVSKSTISAYVIDDRGLPVPDGTTIQFTSTGGTLSSNSATTDGGRTQITLTSETIPKDVTVFGTSGNSVGDVRVRFYSTAVGRIELRANPSSGIPADGNSSSIITASVYDVYNNPVPDGTVVRFTTTWGSLEAMQVTTLKGIGTVRLFSYYDSDLNHSARVTAVSGDKSATIVVGFERYSGPPRTPNTPLPTSTPTQSIVPTNTPSPSPVKTQTPSPTPASTSTSTPHPTTTPSPLPALPTQSVKQL